MSSSIAFTSVAPIYDVVMILNSPPFFVKLSSSESINLSPLHFIKETNISIRSHERISFLNSLSSCGSRIAPVNNELRAIDVSGRSILALSFTANLVSVLSKTASNCSALSETDSPLMSSSVIEETVSTIAFTTSICLSTLLSF